MYKPNKTTLAIALGVTTALFGLKDAAAVDLNLGGGWKGAANFQIQAFLTDDSNETESATRIRSGFDPSKLTLSATAPTLKSGATVSATYQIAQSLNASGGDPDATTVRVAELALAGDFGTFKAGRSWQIFGANSLLHDTGSLPGVGGQCGGSSVENVGASCGRIGYGYVWTDFAPGVQYGGNSGNLSYNIGIFDGQDVSGEPRVEAGIMYSTDNFDIWASAMNESQGDTEGKVSAIDFGAEARFGGFALTGAFTDGEGIGLGIRGLNRGFDTDFYFVEADYTAGKTTYGFSFGARNEDIDDSESELTMAFIHHKINSYSNVVLEISNEETTDSAGNVTFDQDVIALGYELVF